MYSVVNQFLCRVTHLDMESHTVLWILLSLIATLVGSIQNLLFQELRRDEWIAASVVPVLPKSLEGENPDIYAALYKINFNVTVDNSDVDLRKASVNVNRTCLQQGVEHKPQLISVDVYDFIPTQPVTTMKVDFMPYDVSNYEKENCEAFTFIFVCTDDNDGTPKANVVFDYMFTTAGVKKR